MRPLCECHGEPMAKNGRQPVTRNQKWQCGVGNRQRAADWYDAIPGMKYAERLLRQRRYHALARGRR